MFVRSFRFAVVVALASLSIGATASSAFAATTSEMISYSTGSTDIAVLAIQPPELQNRESIQRILATRAAPWLDSRGKVKTVRLRLEIDEEGRVRGFDLLESTGNPFLDRDVRGVIPDMRFSPALEANRPVSSVVEMELRLRSGQAR